MSSELTLPQIRYAVEKMTHDSPRYTTAYFRTFGDLRRRATWEAILGAVTTEVLYPEMARRLTTAHPTVTTDQPLPPLYAAVAMADEMPPPFGDDPEDDPDATCLADGTLIELEDDTPEEEAWWTHPLPTMT